MHPPRVASKGEKKEHNLHFAFSFLREPNYVIFVKASLPFPIFSFSHLSSLMVEHLRVGAAYLGGDLVVGF